MWREARTVDAVAVLDGAGDSGAVDGDAMIGTLYIIDGGNRAKPVRHRKARSRRLWTIQSTLAGFRVAYVRTVPPLSGGAA